MSFDVKKLQGAHTALVTPFDDRDRVDVAALERIVDKQIELGINGLVACGTTGETPTLSDAEIEQVTKIVQARSRGRVPVIVGTGSNSTRVAAENSKRAASWGADFALVVCPYYNKPTQEGLFQHFRAVHEACGLPIIAYNVPGRTVSDLLPETIARLVDAGIIVSVKDATGNMLRATETLSLVPDGKPFALLSGDDFTILPFVACGGVGVISVVSNLVPGDTARLVRLSIDGQAKEARALHARIVALSKALFSVSSPIPVKAGMALAGWCRPNVRLPLVNASAETTDVMKKALQLYRGQGQASLEGFAS